MATVKAVSKDGIGHAFDEDRTDTFIMSYDDARGASQKTFFSVSEPLWAGDGQVAHPKGTIVLFHGANERSELYTDFIQQKTDEGFRVVALDLPGSGRSSRDAQVGSENLLHSDTFDEHSDAALKVINWVNSQEKYSQNPGGTHFVSSQTGNLAALDTIAKSPAGTVESLTLINPVFDFDATPANAINPVGAIKSAINYYTGSSILKKPSTSSNTHPDADSNDEITKITGENLENLRSQFSQGADPAKWTKGYVESFTAAAEKLGGEDIITTLQRNGLSISVILDPDIDQWGGFDMGESTDWAEKAGASLITLPGEGIDLMFNPKHTSLINGIINSNIQNTVYVGLVDKLGTIHRVEWDQMDRTERQDIQQTLEAKGYSVGPTGTDGTPSYGGVSFTEHAIAQFMIDAAEQGALRKSANGGPVKLNELTNNDFNPETIKEIIENSTVVKPPLNITPATPASNIALPGGP